VNHIITQPVTLTVHASLTNEAFHTEFRVELHGGRVYLHIGGATLGMTPDSARRIGHALADRVDGQQEADLVAIEASAR
jgi:hypothetical protein